MDLYLEADQKVQQSSYSLMESGANHSLSDMCDVLQAADKGSTTAIEIVRRSGFSLIIPFIITLSLILSTFAIKVVIEVLGSYKAVQERNEKYWTFVDGGLVNFAWLNQIDRIAL